MLIRCVNEFSEMGSEKPDDNENWLKLYAQHLQYIWYIEMGDEILFDDEMNR